jgi:hypothetical protein
VRSWSDLLTLRGRCEQRGDGLADLAAPSGADADTFVIDASLTPTPVPAALPLFATGIGTFGWSRHHVTSTSRHVGGGLADSLAGRSRLMFVPAMKSFLRNRGPSLAIVVLILFAISLAQGAISYTMSLGALRGVLSSDVSLLTTGLIVLRFCSSSRPLTLSNGDETARFAPGALPRFIIVPTSLLTRPYELGAASFSHRMDRLINRTQNGNTSRLQSR